MCNVKCERHSTASNAIRAHCTRIPLACLTIAEPLLAKKHTHFMHTIQLASRTRIIQILDRIPRLMWIWCIHCIRVAANCASLESNARKTGRDIAGQKHKSTMCACACTVRYSLHALWRTHIFEFSSVCRPSIQSRWLAGDWQLNSIYVYYFIFRFAATFWFMHCVAGVGTGTGTGERRTCFIFVHGIPFQHELDVHGSRSLCAHHYLFIGLVNQVKRRK